tara:strand:- start:46844 stop:48553 length:1710 start_codon:yes stop_codon:yes gene_type:complete
MFLVNSGSYFMSLNFFYTILISFLFLGNSYAQNNETVKSIPTSQESPNLQVRRQIDSLHQGSNKVYGLSGKGQQFAIWEAGIQAYPKMDNPLLEGRWTIGDTFLLTGEHANSLAEYILANPNPHQSKGIAYQAKGIYFDTQNFWDEFPNITGQINLSFHPYALDPGWQRSYPKANDLFWGGLEEIDKKQDYNFGRYSEISKRWDSILFLNPNHLAIKSAGNSRGQREEGIHYFFRSKNNSITEYYLDSSKTPREKDGGDLGYDCLEPASVAKNSLVVGAYFILENGQGKIQKSSSFGPTDDGRIKPDLVAFGENTSQSAATLTGLVLLLQEQYEFVYKEPAKSFVMKCILLHNVDDIGAFKGPDYKSGWGLLNANRSSRFIANSPVGHKLILSTIENGDTLKIYGKREKSKSIKVTLVWNDPEAHPIKFKNHPSLLNNEEPMLQNDLDIQILEVASSCIMYPFVLNPQRPEMPAKKGRNFRDNVEQVLWENPRKEWYEIIISHKGELENKIQDFALAINGMEEAFAFDGKKWYPREPRPDEYDKPILILKAADISKLENFENYQNLNFQ